MQDPAEVNANPYRPPATASQPPAPPTIAPKFPERLCMTFSGAPSVEDVRQVLSLASDTRRPSWFRLSLILAFAVATTLLIGPELILLWLGIFLGFIAGPIYFTLASRRTAARDSRDGKGLYGPAEWTLDVTGITMTSEYSLTRHAWAGFDGHRAADSVLLLHTVGGVFFPFYRSLFPSGELWEAFVAWVKATYPVTPGGPTPQ